MATRSEPKSIEEVIQEELLLCKICFEEMIEPKCLPYCLHTYCLKCLEEHAKNNRILLTNKTLAFSCPECRHICQMPKEGLKTLKGNFHIQKLKDVVQIRQGKDMSSNVDVLPCEEHPEMKAESFCTTCFKSLCPDCVKLYHKKPYCKVITANLGDVLNTLQQQEKTKIESLRKDIDKWKIPAREIKKGEKIICKTREDLLQEVNKHYLQIESQIQKEKKLICEKIEGIFQKNDNSKDCIAIVDMFDENITTAETYLEEYNDNCDETGTVHEKLKYRKNVHEQLSKYSDHLQEMYEGISQLTLSMPSQVEFRKNTEIEREPFAKLHIKQKLEKEEKSLEEIEPVEEVWTPSVPSNVDPERKKCNFLSEFSIKYEEDSDEAGCGGVVCIGSTIFVNDLINECIKVFDSQGATRRDVEKKINILGENQVLLPASFCTLSGSKLVISYDGSNVVCIYDTLKNTRSFQKVERINCITCIAGLPNERLALSFDKVHLEVYDSRDIPKKEHMESHKIDPAQDPMFICSDKADKIFFSDLNHVYDYDLQTKSTRILSGMQQDFSPRGLCIDSVGNLLVANKKFSKIHLYLKLYDYEEEILLQQEDGLEEPVDVAFNGEGNLVVGEASGKVKIFSY